MRAWNPLRLLLAGLLLSIGLAASAAPDPVVVDGEAVLVVFNRPVATFRGSFLGMSPTARVARARATLDEALRESGDMQVRIKENPEGFLVMLDDRLAFVITPADADALRGEAPADAAKAAATRLETIVAETREARNLRALTKAVAFAAAATAVYALLLFGLSRLRQWVSRHLVLVAARKARSLKIGGTHLVETHSFVPHLLRLLDFCRWLLVALFSYQWLSFVLSCFPYTRPWGEQLNHYLYNLFVSLAESMLDALPGIGVALVIFLIARFVAGFAGRLLARVASSEASSPWLSIDTLPTTRRLISIAIWLFALAMAYPYLPGAQTEAFKGLSVLVGLMVSLGATSIVGQGAAGLILTYTRTIRKGEYVRIGDHEGTVVEMGMFTTRIRTGLGEELTLPNSMITGSVTKNYSRAVHGEGYIVDTTVTIGYDTPWRQVEAMLVEAARRTPGVLESPNPRVFQTALSDYYPEYRLVAQAIPSEPRPRAEVLTMLHKNIQDVFNEYGVQIMSPHYMADPEQAKVVPPERWHEAPAQKPDA
jgi:small-conductance mechanosensitive channel